MGAIRQAGESGAAFAREHVKPAALRVASRVGPAEALLARRAARREQVARLVGMYDALRARMFPKEEGRGDAELPSIADISRVQREVLESDRTLAGFFRALTVDGNVERAMITMTRRLIDDKHSSRARSIAQTWQRYGDLRPVADLCLALCALVDPVPETAWILFDRTDIGLVLKWAPEEYFRFMFQYHPDVAAATLRRVLDGELALTGTPADWTDIAYYGFSAGSLDLAREALQRVDPDEVEAGPERRQLRARRAALSRWLDNAAKRPVAVDDGEVVVALVGFDHPDRRSASRDLADPTETLAVLGHLARYRNVRFTGEPSLVAAAEDAGRDIPETRRLDGPAATVRLVELTRDVSQYSALPDGTWAVVSDWFSSPLAGAHYDMPLDPAIRPIFVSFHIEPQELAAPGVADYLREHAPVGCRDRATAYLLHSAGVPAFFSGAVTATLDLVVPPASSPSPVSEVEYLDLPAGEGGVRRTRFSDNMRKRGLGENLRAAAAFWRGFRDRRAEVVTDDLRSSLSARAVGCAVQFRPADQWDHTVDDYLELSERDFARMQRSTTERLEAVLGPLLAGKSEVDVRQAWQQACEPGVQEIEAELSSVTGSPQLTFDLAKACRVIRAASVTIERSERDRDGDEINVEFSVDQNYTHQLDIVLDSVVEKTSRPIRAFVLCRGLNRAHFDRMARLFPMVSFVWLPTDNVNYGRIPGKIHWATVVTMDRTILPALLDDVDRMLHFDLDALCLGDLAELYDVDFEGTAIAAAPEQPRYRSGFETVRRGVKLLRRQGKPDLAREYLLRMHAEHPFDFEVFNAGIMVMDLAKMREDDFCGRYLPFVQRFGINGQNVLAVYTGRKRKAVSSDWNRLMRLELPETPQVAHWGGPFKPWRPNAYVYGRELWRDQEDRFAARTALLAG